MTTPDEVTIEQEIVERLEASENKDDIIFDLCNRLGLGWKEVETLVERVHIENETHIALGQSPLLVLLALVMFIGGVGLSGYATYGLIDTYEMFMGIRGDRESVLAGFLIYLIANGEGYFWAFIFGAGMIIGSLRGMQDVWSTVFAKFGLFQAD